jgi:hypothetical protein
MIISVDLLYVARKGKEGFQMDLSGVDLSGVDLSGSLVGSEVDSSGSSVSATKPTRYLETAVKNMFKETMVGNDLEEIQEDSLNMKKVVENAKEASPELAEALKNSQTIDIQEFNTLINRLNRMVSNVAD